MSEYFHQPQMPGKRPTHQQLKLKSYAYFPTFMDILVKIGPENQYKKKKKKRSINDLTPNFTNKICQTGHFLSKKHIFPIR
jgi:hypothetical protein